MLEHGIIEKSTSPWSFPVVIVKERTSGLRFAIDFCKLNAVTRPIRFPLPTLGCVFDCLGAASPKYLTNLDLHSGYWQHASDDESHPKTSFVVPEGQYQFRRMPFGLANAPACFQSLVTKVLRGLNWKFAMVYVDDILVFSKHFEEH